jgi:hypothetical protein
MSPSMSQPIRRRITRASPTPEKLGVFLRHLEESGSVSFAAQRTGIGRNTVYERRRTDPAFAAGWRKAMEMAGQALLDTAITRAREGTERGVWRRGRRVGTIREYNGRLLMFLLRRLKPEVFSGQVRRSGLR